MRLQTQHRRAGLSLLEVLVSTMIFFMAIVAISGLVDMGTNRELEARFNATATRLAQAKMAEFESGITPFTSTSGDFSDTESEPGWTWNMTADTQGTNLYLVTLTVSRDLKGQTFSVTLGQMILDPTLKGPIGQATRPDPSGQ